MPKFTSPVVSDLAVVVPVSPPKLIVLPTAVAVVVYLIIRRRIKAYRQGLAVHIRRNTVSAGYLQRLVLQVHRAAVRTVRYRQVLR